MSAARARLLAYLAALLLGAFVLSGLHRAPESRAPSPMAEDPLPTRPVRLFGERRFQPVGNGAPVFSPDGPRIATTGPEDRDARVWDAATGRLLRRFARAPYL